MKNKGFTLVEMLAVIALLAIIGTITTVSVRNIMKNQNVENKLNVISAIMTGTRNYITEHHDFFSNSAYKCDWTTGLGDGYKVSLDKLFEGGYVDFDKQKYKELYGTASARLIFVQSCSGNPLKYQIVYDYYGSNASSSGYFLSDCGCEKQASNKNAYKFCDARNKGAGWDVNGNYYDNNHKLTSTEHCTTSDNKNKNYDNDCNKSLNFDD